jgi:muramoyltetrapeptide carboxypeptidase
VVAPSGPYDVGRLEQGMAVIRRWGLRVQRASELPGVHSRLGYLAGEDAARAAELTAAWCDPATAAVWAARGGYGAQRMVDLVDYAALRAAGPRHFVGFSDVTALHTRMGRELGQVTLHGPVAAGIGQLTDPDTTAALRRWLLHPPVPGAVLATGRTLVAGPVAAGRLVGGNLSLVASDVGIEPVPTEPVVALFEDVGEEGYRVDRMVTQLVRAGWFAQVRGVVLGDFTEPGDPDLVPAALADRLATLGVPVLAGVAVGHGSRNLALPLGADVRLDPASGRLTLAE